MEARPRGETSVPTGSAEASYPPLRSGVIACILLAFAQMLALVDRQVLNLLVQPIKADLGLTDFKFSLLQGLAFVIFNSTAGLILGYLVDKTHRRNIMMTCLAVWSLATMACGLSRNFWQLFGARIALGAGEAGLEPASYSLMCDFFRPKHRGRAFAVVGMAGTFGFALALFGGGVLYNWISENHATLGAFAAGYQPWQLTFMVAGAPGVLLFFAFFLIKEPPRRIVAETTADRASVLKFAWAKKEILAALVIQFGTYRVAAYAMLSWTAAYYMRRFGVSIFEAGMITGGILLAASPSSILTGFLGDRWTRLRAFGGRLRTPVLGFFIMTPGVLLQFLAGDLKLSIAGGVIAWVGSSMTGTTAPLALVDVVPGQYRGRIATVYILVTLLLGVILGPLLVASFTDFVFHDEAKLNYAMILTILPAISLSALSAVLIMKRYTAELALAD